MFDDAGIVPVERDSTLWDECIAEGFATYILVFFAAGVVHVAVLVGTLTGLWPVAIVTGLGIALAIYALGAISGAHMNPAVTLAFFVHRRFPGGKVLPYIASQVLGALLAAATLYALFHGLIAHYELVHGIHRGLPGSERSAMVYGNYFPNPASCGVLPGGCAAVSLPHACLTEALGTALLVFFIFALTDTANPASSGDATGALFIGLAVAIIMATLSPFTGASLNPARDFGPRLFAYLAGWGAIAIPGPHSGFFLVYILAPLLGGLAGSTLYQHVVHPRHHRS